MTQKKESIRLTRKLHFKNKIMLSYKPPFSWDGMLSFFEKRAISGVERIQDGRYYRTIRLGDICGAIAVRQPQKQEALELGVHLTDGRGLSLIAERVRRMFDLDANMPAIYRVLKSNPLLNKIIEKRKGMRLPIAWDPFELAVRAVVGQQISVKAARTVLGRIVQRAGPPFETQKQTGLMHYFPTAMELSNTDLSAIGMPQKRIESLNLLSRAIAAEKLSIQVKGKRSDFIKKIIEIPGIGEWTANYIAMRGLGEADAFPASDLGIIRALSGEGGRLTRKQISEMAENWRPWRAYAAIYLWHA